MHANTGAWTQVFQSQRAVFLLHHHFALFLFKVSSILDLRHWVIGSGHNPMACLWPASGVKQVFWKFKMDLRRERSVATCQGPQPRLWPSHFSTDPHHSSSPRPLNPDPKELWPLSVMSLNVRWACGETGSGASQNEEGGIDGGQSEWRRNESCLCEGRMFGFALSKRESFCSVLLLSLIDYLKAAKCCLFWSLHIIFTRGQWCFIPVSHIWVDKCNCLTGV